MRNGFTSVLRQRMRGRKKKKSVSTRTWTFLVPEQNMQPFAAIPDNPCIPYMRKVIEALLERRGLGYREFYPVILDFEEVDMTGDSFVDYETEREILRLRRQLDRVLMQLVPGLNRMILRTSRPAYFSEFVQTMYEEYGLLVQLEEKSDVLFPKDCFVIDFELWGEPVQRMFREDMIYLPIYRKPWEIVRNLDILVPIGYNTVIVEGAVTAACPVDSDKFEREFYS